MLALVVVRGTVEPGRLTRLGQDWGSGKRGNPSEERWIGESTGEKGIRETIGKHSCWNEDRVKGTTGFPAGDQLGGLKLKPPVRSIYYFGVGWNASTPSHYLVLEGRKRPPRTSKKAVFPKVPSRHPTPGVMGSDGTRRRENPDSTNKAGRGKWETLSNRSINPVLLHLTHVCMAVQRGLGTNPISRLAPQCLESRVSLGSESSDGTGCGWTVATGSQI
ncbi:hypothetical protein VTI74DRAFT_9997 [Chaetomium olivicolor]